MRDCDLSDILSWRNHPGVRNFMLTQHEITVDEHRRWFERASKDQTNSLLVIEEFERPLGCVTFSGVKRDLSAEWSFYASPDGEPGTGTKVCSAAIEYAFSVLGVHKIVGRVLEFNLASIRLHERLGFFHEGTLRQQQLIHGVYYDLLCFGLLSSEWAKVNRTANS